jgi:hypothetical protein
VFFFYFSHVMLVRHADHCCFHGYDSISRYMSTWSKYIVVALIMTAVSYGVICVKGAQMECSGHTNMFKVQRQSSYGVRRHINFEFPCMHAPVDGR